MKESTVKITINDAGDDDDQKRIIWTNKNK